MVVAALAIASVWATSAFAAVDPDAVRAHVDAAYADRDYQRDMPSPTPAAPPQARPSARSSAIAQTALLVAAAVALFLVVAWLARELRRPSAAPADDSHSPTPPDSPRDSPTPGAGEIRAMLAQALAAIEARTGQPLAPAQTAREILRAVRLPAPARGALSELVAAAESAVFAEARVGADDVRRCSSSLERLREHL